MSIATEISRLQSAKASIKTAIEGKGVTVPSATLLDGYAALIASIPSGGGDGLPAWLKDGDTHLWIDIRNTYQLEQQIRIRMIGTIDWGDGTAAQSVSVTTYTTFTHTYAAPGRYRIDLHPTSGTFYLGGGSSSYCVMGERSTAATYRIGTLYQAEVGTSRITDLSNSVFFGCCSLQRVYIPSNITTIGSSAFRGCYALAEAIFQDSSKITSTTTITYAFYNDVCLQTLSFAPPEQTVMTYEYQGCQMLSEAVIPGKVTSLGSQTFYNCYSLRVLRCLPTTPPTASTNSFTNVPATCRVEVPAASLSAYQSATYWSALANQMVGV